MTLFLTVLHVVACVFLVAVVLLQRGKGAEIGAVFGGGASSTVFGSRGAGNFLTRMTALSAFVFMCTSLSLAYTGTTASSDRLFDDGSALEDATETETTPLFEEVGIAPADLEDAAPADDASSDGLLQGLDIPETPPAP